jgi:membrane protein
VDTEIVPRGLGQLFGKFQADRGTQLAAMIAYYALLSFVPLTFLAFSILGLIGQADESSTLVDGLSHIFPSSSVSAITKTVDDLQSHAATFGILGLLFLIWTSLGLFGALESAFNIVYGRPNRSFVSGKTHSVLLLIGLLVVLFVGLGVASFGFGQLERLAPGISGSSALGYALPVIASSIAVFCFLIAVYYMLTNVEHTLRDVLPGALVATAVLEGTFQALPIYLRLSRNSTAQQAFGAPVLLLVWMYLMANVIVFGAELNWWRQHRASPLLLGSRL